jgi:hypothetical protein
MTKNELKSIIREVISEEIQLLEKRINENQKKILVPLLKTLNEERKRPNINIPETSKLADVAHRKFAQSTKRPQSKPPEFKNPMLNSIFADTKPLTESSDDLFSFEDDGTPMMLSTEGVPIVDTLQLEQFDFSRTLKIMESASSKNRL